MELIIAGIITISESSFLKNEPFYNLIMLPLKRKGTNIKHSAQIREGRTQRIGLEGPPNNCRNYFYLSSAQSHQNDFYIKELQWLTGTGFPLYCLKLIRPWNNFILPRQEITTDAGFALSALFSPAIFRHLGQVSTNLLLSTEWGIMCLNLSVWPV